MSYSNYLRNLYTGREGGGIEEILYFLKNFFFSNVSSLVFSYTPSLNILQSVWRHIKSLGVHSQSPQETLPGSSLAGQAGVGLCAGVGDPSKDLPALPSAQSVAASGRAALTGLSHGTGLGTVVRHYLFRTLSAVR